MISRNFENTISEIDCLLKIEKSFGINYVVLVLFKNRW